jgi:hypothetical protein
MDQEQVLIDDASELSFLGFIQKLSVPNLIDYHFLCDDRLVILLYIAVSNNKTYS